MGLPIVPDKPCRYFFFLAYLEVFAHERSSFACSNRALSQYR
jgi:hypothetical protein